MSIWKGMKLNSSNAREFIFFLLLTAVVATLIKLSKSYDITRRLNVKVTGLPLDRTVSEITPQSIEVNAQASGFALLQNIISGEKLNVPFDELESDGNGTYLFEPAEHQNTIQRSIAGQGTIFSLKPKIVRVQIDSLSSKKIAIIPRTKISYATGFSAASAVRVVPDSITVVGPSNVLSKITLIQTKTLSASEANKDIQEVVAIDADSLYSTLRFSQRDVAVEQKIVRFTEGTVTVPIKILNDPQNKLKILPKTVQVVYRVALDDFEKVGASDFLVSCDYRKSSTTNDYLSLKIEKQPSVVRSARLSTKQVKYIVVN